MDHYKDAIFLLGGIKFACKAGTLERVECVHGKVLSSMVQDLRVFAGERLECVL